MKIIRKGLDNCKGHEWRSTFDDVGEPFYFYCIHCMEIREVKRN